MLPGFLRILSDNLRHSLNVRYRVRSGKESARSREAVTQRLLLLLSLSLLF